MKKIRIEYYRYRIRKGRVDVLLQKIEGGDTFCIPCRYAEEGDRVDGLIRNGEIDDDGDLVIRLVDAHMSSRNLVWTPLGELTERSLARNDRLESYKTIFRLFLLSRNQDSGGNKEALDPSLLSKIEGWYDSILRERAKLRYVDCLKETLKGTGPIVLDACVIPPTKDTIEREIDTLEHFNPEREKDDYYLNIDWKALGWRFEPVSFPRGIQYKGLYGLNEESEE